MCFQVFGSSLHSVYFHCRVTNSHELLQRSRLAHSSPARSPAQRSSCQGLAELTGNGQHSCVPCHRLWTRLALV